MEDKRTAKFPSTDSAEVDAVTIFKYLINTDKVKFDANERDKIPAVDGDIYLVDENGEIKGKLIAQVKKLPDRNQDSPKKQFDVATLNHYTVDPAPFVLILVDIEREISYWVYVDSSFIENLDISAAQKTKVIHFPKENAIDGVNESYITEWKQITADRLGRVKTEKKYQEAYEELRENANPAIGKEREFFYSIHEFLDEYNSLVKEQIPVLNKWFYADAWKIGIAIEDTTRVPLSYGFYPVPWNRNDTQIKEVEEHVIDEIDEASIIVTHSFENPIYSRPKAYARERVHSEIEKVLRNQGLIHGVNQFLAREFLFAFIDEFSDPLGLVGGQNEYGVNELKQGFYQYLPFWIDETIQLFNSKDRGSYVNERGIDLRLLQSGIMPKEMADINQTSRERFNMPGESAGSYPIDNRSLIARSVEEFIVYLEQNGIKKIDRPYVQQDVSQLRQEGGGSIWEGYSRKDIGVNLDAFFGNLHEAFNDVVRANFLGISDDIRLFDDASVVVITYGLQESTASHVPTVSIYYLTRLSSHSPENCPSKILIKHDQASRYYDWHPADIMGKQVEVGDKQYTVDRTSSRGLRFLFRDQPLMKYIYREVGQNVGDALNIDATIRLGLL